MSRTERQMHKLLDRYTILQLDYEEWLKKNINPSRDVRDGEWSNKDISKIGVTDITFKRPFKLGRSFVVNRMFYHNTWNKWVLEGGVLRDVTEYVPLDHLDLKEQNALIYELKDRGYFDDAR